MLQIDNNEKGKHFRVDYDNVLYFGDEARQLGERLVLEHFEGDEICNQDGEEIESLNLKRAEMIFEEFIESGIQTLEEYLET